MPEGPGERHLLHLWLPIISNSLLFLIFFGLTGDVDVAGFRSKFTNGAERRGLAAGVFGQFFLLPFLAFVVVRAFDVPRVEGITLLVIASSPGGAFSNWWCSLYNADLALSIAMTSTSTLLSLALLPANTFLYVTLSFGVNVPINFMALGVSCAIVLLGTGLGLLVVKHRPQHRRAMHIVGNGAALVSTVGSAFLSSAGPIAAPLWHRRPVFYASISTMCAVALLLGVAFSSALRLPKPQRVALAIEIMYQNIAIAATAVFSMFHEREDMADAAGVPLFYGTVCAVLLFVFCNVAWKAGWTLAPPSDPYWRVLVHNYQPAAPLEAAVVPEALPPPAPGTQYSQLESFS
eukprot:EG_transcript_12682